jgi:hypothetical protein
MFYVRATIPGEICAEHCIALTSLSTAEYIHARPFWTWRVQEHLNSMTGLQVQNRTDSDEVQHSQSRS